MAIYKTKFLYLMIKDDMELKFQQKLNKIKDNPKLNKAFDVFERSQKTYEQAVKAITVREKPRRSGSYSSSLSKKNYYANFSTTTR